MRLHDPYSPILEALRQLNCCDTDERLLERLSLTRPVVKHLRRAYRECPCHVDYSSENTRAAYLLAYYPYYIEIVYTELSKLQVELLPSSWNGETITACFFGGGPCPEVVGWLTYLSEHCQNIKSVTIYILDKYAESWSVCREITQTFVLPSYWNGRIEIRAVNCDLADCDALIAPLTCEAIATSNFFVMQNWLNDQPGTSVSFDNFESIQRNIMSMVENAPNDSLFIFADLNFPRVHHLFRSIEQSVQIKQIARLLLPVPNNRYSITPNIQYPPLLNELFIGEDGLVRKKHTRYFSIMIKK